MNKAVCENMQREGRLLVNFSVMAKLKKMAQNLVRMLPIEIL